MIRPAATFSLSLEDAARIVGSSSDSQVVFTGVAFKDSDVKTGDLFIASPGARFHGAEFIAKAAAQGAVAVLTDAQGQDRVGDLPAIIVEDVRTASALIASRLYSDPMRSLHSIGITGTNGKTTVSTLLYQIFTAADRKSGLIGTVETRVGDQIIASVRTTPEAPELQALAASMREQGAENLVMEVSSHAISLKRMKGSHFSIVGFTNLTQDHLDFHHDMDSYFAAKAELFTSEYADKGFINIDSPYGVKLFDNSTISNVSVSRDNAAAMWRYAKYSRNSHGYTISVQGPDKDLVITTETQLLGGFNLDNLLMAIAIASNSGVGTEELVRIVPTLKGAAGRLESVQVGQEFTALVDYAHSPDAVSSVLRAAKEFTEGRVIAVLGCGGDRDASKRPLMGKALAEGSDIAIFTSDNPRSESPSAILDQMTAGVSLTEPSQICEDRAGAIKCAVEIARAGDTVLILGKGHESGQDIAGVVTPFDDRLELARAIQEVIGGQK